MDSDSTLAFESKLVKEMLLNFTHIQIRDKKKKAAGLNLFLHRSCFTCEINVCVKKEVREGELIKRILETSLFFCPPLTHTLKKVDLRC